MAVFLLWSKRMDLTWSVFVLTVLAVHSMAVRWNLALASPDTVEQAYSSTRELRGTTDNNTSTDNSGSNGGEERSAIIDSVYIHVR
ncbi:hypothetical protein GBAR_LOCUS25253 [Geodia barretti]|uniref:Uncharacterized protein n=1 Tax=Geodia barretti TaxID=519541 RepID=A0AA35TEU6_GEOBA|nr:hypothetical protein GBAR_LOCUS25253 [Geodia barretti]